MSALSVHYISSVGGCFNVQKSSLLPVSTASSLKSSIQSTSEMEFPDDMYPSV